MALDLWLNDFRRCLEFVEPVDAHDAVYSHRMYELLLRGATEFESVAKSIIVLGGNSLTTNANIYEYRDKLKHLKPDDVEVGALFWQPTVRYFAPFRGWMTSTPPLAWYGDYNSVKHSRRSAFSKASLSNAVQAGCGVFALLALGFGMGLLGQTGMSSDGFSKLAEHCFGDLPLTLRVPA